VNGDRTRLAQALGNVLQNAAKFTLGGGKTFVLVTADSARKEARVEVADTGSGIPPDVLPHVFEPFTQAETTLDRAQGGLGLGLSLVKGLVETHGGTVSAASGGVGKGATFTITLPMLPMLPMEEEAIHETNARGTARSSAQRVLIIEDNIDSAETLREALELGGHPIAVAYTGTEGLAKAHAFHPDVVLCDIGLPAMDGYAVARAIRADPELERITLVALTGYGQPEDVSMTRGAGFDVHLVKPPDIEVLEDVIAHAPVAANQAPACARPSAS
jgi:two-component system CheB/CheR fusion protein